MRRARKKRKVRPPLSVIQVPQELYDLAKAYKTARAVLAVAPIGYATAQALIEGTPLVMTYENYKHIKKCLKAGDSFSFANKLRHIMSSPKIATAYVDKLRSLAKFIAENPWITSSGSKITKVYSISETHIPLISTANELKKVAKLLNKIHKTVPEYDDVIFAGTGYLEVIDEILQRISNNKSVI